MQVQQPFITGYDSSYSDACGYAYIHIIIIMFIIIPHALQVANYVCVKSYINIAKEARAPQLRESK